MASSLAALHSAATSHLPHPRRQRTAANARASSLLRLPHRHRSRWVAAEVVFRRDLEWCPNFNNLTTLLLNEWWCKDPDFYALNLILKHSPVLEKLNLHLFTKGPQHKVEIIGRYSQMERSATILKHLKEVEVKCDVINDEVHKVLKFLGTLGISFLFK